jgi:glycosyltransferase involved in cell wall biosynthesis
MLSAIVITKNEQAMIGDCLASLNFADEIIVVDNGNTDATNSIAKSHAAKIINSIGTDYSAVRNDGLAAASGDWILFVDADERVTPDLSQEILQLISSRSSVAAYQIPRKNFYLGQEMSHGGWGGDAVIRLFKKAHLARYVNRLHEQPEFTGQLGFVHSSFLHYSHRDLTSMLDKTIHFTDFESQLRYDSGHPRIVTWRLVRVMITEFWLRFITLSAWRDGPKGIIDGLFQVFNTFIIYARLWEKQLS